MWAAHGAQDGEAEDNPKPNDGSRDGDGQWQSSSDGDVGGGRQGGSSHQPDVINLEFCLGF